MSSDLRVIGAGLPRTGTYSLRVALEELLGRTCYHMSTLFERENVDVPAWSGALRDEAVNWSAVFDGCTAAIDWPASVFWRELAAAYPEALVVLSVRDNPETWWRSADATVWPVMRRQPEPKNAEWFAMAQGLMHRVFGSDWDDQRSAKATYDRHNARVRTEVPANRLLEWRASDGWAPLCTALGLPEPDAPFPRLNTTEEWLERQRDETT